MISIQKIRNLIYRAHRYQRHNGVLSLPMGVLRYLRLSAESYLQKFRDSGRFTFRGVQLEGGNFHPVIRRTMEEDDFEKFQCDYIEGFLPTDSPTVDIGAGMGVTSSLAFKHTKAPVIAVEANPTVWDTLTEHLELNECDYEIYKRAYSPTGGSVELSLADLYRDSSAVYEPGHRTETVDAVSLETIVQEQELEEFSLLSNAEGIEYRLIEGELELLQEQADCLIISFHDLEPIESTPNEMDERLQENGFEKIADAGHVRVFKNKSI